MLVFGPRRGILVSKLVWKQQVICDYGILSIAFFSNKLAVTK